jgi:hypothetical protein
MGSENFVLTSMAEPNTQQISIFNSDSNRPFNLYVRTDRLQAFHDFIIGERHPEYRSSPMPGVSWAVMAGLDAIFARRPKKFPVHDILSWLANSLHPAVTTDEIEHALERFSALYPPDVSEDA